MRFNNSTARPYIWVVATIKTSCQKALGYTDGWQARYEPAVCPYSTESQLYLGLHQKKGGQWVEVGDPAPLFFTGDSSPGLLHPLVESLV